MAAISRMTLVLDQNYANRRYTYREADSDSDYPSEPMTREACRAAPLLCIPCCVPIAFVQDNALRTTHDKVKFVVGTTLIGGGAGMLVGGGIGFLAGGAGAPPGAGIGLAVGLGLGLAVGGLIIAVKEFQ